MFLHELPLCKLKHIIYCEDVCVLCAVVTEKRSKLYHLKMLPFSSTACDSSTELFSCAEKPDPLQSLWESQEGPQWDGSSNDLMQ